jgi:hypothetical protein
VVGANAVVNRLARIVRVREVEYGLARVQAVLIVGKLEIDAGTGVLGKSVCLTHRGEGVNVRTVTRCRIHRGRAGGLALDPPCRRS